MGEDEKRLKGTRTIAGHIRKEEKMTENERYAAEMRSIMKIAAVEEPKTEEEPKEAEKKPEKKAKKK